MNDLFPALMLIPVAVGFYLAGRIHEAKRTVRWRITCILLEHRLAEIENRTPKDIADL